MESAFAEIVRWAEGATEEKKQLSRCTMRVGHCEQGPGALSRPPPPLPILHAVARMPSASGLLLAAYSSPAAVLDVRWRGEGHERQACHCSFPSTCLQAPSVCRCGRRQGAACASLSTHPPRSSTSAGFGGGTMGDDRKGGGGGSSGLAGAGGVWGWAEVAGLGGAAGGAKGADSAAVRAAEAGSMPSRGDGMEVQADGW